MLRGTSANEEKANVTTQFSLNMVPLQRPELSQPGRLSSKARDGNAEDTQEPLRTYNTIDGIENRSIAVVQKVAPRQHTDTSNLSKTPSPVPVTNGGWELPHEVIEVPLSTQKLSSSDAR